MASNKNSPPKSPIIFEVVDPLGYTVYMTEEKWYGHITINHPDMAGEADTVKETLQNPNCIYPSSEYTDRNVYFKDRNAKYSKLKYCKVIVEYNDDSKRGEVVTSYKRPTISGGIIDDSPKYIRLEL